MSLFISFEGGEGAGKSTQIALLSEWLHAAGRDVVMTREPGGTEGAEAIRALLVAGSAGRWEPRTDALLIAAARSDHVARLVRPALAAGKILLCDRYVHSTLAYQGHGQGLPIAELVRLHDFATDALWPDLVLWLDLPVEAGLRRAAARRGDEDRFERQGTGFHERVRAGFAAMAKEDPRMRRIDATADPDSVAAAIRAEVLPLL